MKTQFKKQKKQERERNYSIFFNLKQMIIWMSKTSRPTKKIAVKFKLIQISSFMCHFPNLKFDIYFHKKIYMFELTQFCSLYLPKYFHMKFESFLDVKSCTDFRLSDSIYELTTKIVSLVDHLMAACPDMKAASLIQKYFLFKFRDFSKNRKKSESQKDEGRKIIHEILQSLDQIQRQVFQVFLRMVYVYFLCKETDNSQSKIKEREEHASDIACLYMDLKLKMMTEDDSFNLSDFMEFAIFKLLNLKPSQKFVKFIRTVVHQCDFAEKLKQAIQDKIKSLQRDFQIKIMERIQAKKRMEAQNKNILNFNSQIRENLQQKSPKKRKSKGKTPSKSPKKIDSVVNTPQKQSVNQTMTQIKQHDFDNSSQDRCPTVKKFVTNDIEQNSINSLKKTLELHKKLSKGRTIYERKSSKFVLKKTPMMNDQSSTAGSQEEFVPVDINRKISSRWIPNDDYSDQESQGMLAHATPKPKKKIKYDKSRNGQQIFDFKGVFIPLLSERI